MSAANTIKYFSRLAFRAVFLRLFRVRVTYSAETVDLLHRERVIVCSNHLSFLDGIVVALASPIPLNFGVDTDFSRRSKIARGGLSILSGLGFGEVVPIDSGSPFGIRTLSRALAQGESIMIFPEGAISDCSDGLPAPEKPGLGWLQKRTGAPTVWISIIGAENSKLFAKSGTQLWPRINVKF